MGLQHHRFGFGSLQHAPDIATFATCSRCGMDACRLASEAAQEGCGWAFSKRPAASAANFGRNAMNDTVNRQVLLVEKPAGKLGPEHFKMSRGAVPDPKDGEALLRVRYISLDAANRAWMHGATYRAAVEPNTVMAGGGIAEVVSSKAPGLAPGDIVFGDTGWPDYAAVYAKPLTQTPRLEPAGSAGSAGYRGGQGVCRLGRIDRRPDRQDKGLPCRRHRRRQRQVPL